MKPFLSHLSAKFIRDAVHYDPITGVFHWRYRIGMYSNWNSKWAGKEISYFNSRGYLKIRLDGSIYLGHRVAWIYMTGQWPDRYVDHDDTNTRNNRWANLRLATPSQSGANRNRFKNNTSGLKGVSWLDSLNCYRSSIMKDGEYIYVGSGQCAPALHFNYIVAANKLFGEFARFAEKTTRAPAKSKPEQHFEAIE